MLIVGILMIIISIFMVLYPEFFLKYRLHRLPEIFRQKPKMRILLRVWGIVCIIIGIVLIFYSL